MVARFATGTRVRIREGSFLPQPRLQVWGREVLTGKIVSSSAVVAYAVHFWGSDTGDAIKVVQAYKVHLDVGIEVDSVTEDCLEAL